MGVTCWGGHICVGGVTPTWGGHTLGGSHSCKGGSHPHGGVTLLGVTLGGSHSRGVTVTWGGHTRMGVTHTGENPTCTRSSHVGGHTRTGGLSLSHGGITLIVGESRLHGGDACTGGSYPHGGVHAHTGGSHSHGGVHAHTAGSHSHGGVTLTRQGITFTQGGKGKRRKKERGKQGEKERIKGKGRRRETNSATFLVTKSRKSPFFATPWAHAMSWPVSASQPVAGTVGVWGRRWGFCPSLRGFSPKFIPASLVRLGKRGFLLGAWGYCPSTGSF